VATVPKFDGDANALFRAQLRVVERIRRVGFRMAAKNSNHLLHSFIIGYEAAGLVPIPAKP